MRAALLFAAVFSAIGCIAPITPMERLQQSANDVANALRFDRTDLVADYVAQTAKDDFWERHAVWTEKTRIVDLELAGIFLRTSDEAEAILNVSWLHEDGAMLHTTEISQRWKHEGGTFRLVNEVFRRGDKSLFEMLPKKGEAAAKSGEPVKEAPAKDKAASAASASSGL